jgi:hypothetical protein
VRFYRAVGASPLDSAAAVNGALRRILHEGTGQFTADWRGYVKDALS